MTLKGNEVPTIWHSGKGMSIKTLKRSVHAKGRGGVRNKEADHRAFLGQWKYSACYNNDGYMLFSLRNMVVLLNETVSGSICVYTLSHTDKKKLINEQKGRSEKYTTKKREQKMEPWEQWHFFKYYIFNALLKLFIFKSQTECNLV